MQSDKSNDQFRDKVAVIAGGTRGINLGIAEAFAKRGARVAVFGRDADRAENARKHLEKVAGQPALGMACDVRDYAGVEAALRQAAETFGSIDMLVSGAAGNFHAPVLGLSANAFKTVVDIDLIGTFNVFRASYEYLTRPGASLIAITAGQAEFPIAFQSHAAAAKAGVNMLTKTIAIEWGPAGIRANLISPGAIADTVGVKFLTPNPADFNRAVQRIPARRLGQIREIGEMAAFLCSDEAAYVNGQLIYVDGGLSAGDGSENCLSPGKRN